MANLDILVQLHALRGWRVVEAEANGKRQQCFLIPMEPNGIMLSDTGSLPYWRFSAKPTENKKYGYTHNICPIITKALHEKLVDDGVLAPDEKPWGPYCGGIRYMGTAKYNQEHGITRKRKTT